MKRSKVVSCTALALVGLFVSCAFAYTQMDASFKKNQSDLAKTAAYSAQQQSLNEAYGGNDNEDIALAEKADVPTSQQSSQYWTTGNAELALGDEYAAYGWAHQDAADSMYAGGVNYWGAGNAYYSAWNWDDAYEAYYSSLSYLNGAQDEYGDAGADFYTAKMAYARAYDAFEMISDD